MRSLVIGFALLGLTATTVPAQDPPTQWARPGDTLRVWAETPTLRGARAVVRKSTFDTVFFSVRSAASRSWLEMPVAGDRITRIEIRDEPRTAKSRAFFGVLSGAVIGGAAGGG